MRTSILLFALFAFALAVAQDSWVQVAETDAAHTVFIHIPAVEACLGSLHPAASLFEKPFSCSKSAEQMEAFEKELQKHGINVRRMESVLEKLPHSVLVDIAMDFLTYETPEHFDDDHYFTSDEYKRKALSALDNVELVNDVLLARPKITLTASERNTGVVASVFSLHPFMNLIFARDQQIVTAKGLILANLNSPQRTPETILLRHVWKQADIPFVCDLPRDCGEDFLEGGDFIPISSDLAMLGIGLRSNWKAANYLIEKDLFGTERVAIVDDTMDLSQDRMHLDTYFNIISAKEAIVLEDVLGADSPKKRIVHEFRKVDGVYEKAREVEFGAFLEEEGYRLLKVTNEQQLNYMINFLNIGGNKLLTPNKDLKSVLEENDFEADVTYIPFESVTAMYGAMHCATQVFRHPSVPEIAAEDMII